MLLKEDVGSTMARTMLLDVATGQATVRSYGRPDLVI
jgi:chemotaxis protein CheD